MQAYLHKFPQMVVQGGHLVAVLNVFQRLVANRNNDHYGVQILSAIIDYVPLCVCLFYSFSVVIFYLYSFCTSLSLSLSLSLSR
jgi:exportin-2 (importin alpha re-exporter)